MTPRSNRSSNVGPVVDGLIDSARKLYEEGSEKYRLAAEHIERALELDPSLSLREIGRRMGTSHTSVSRLLDWYRSGADRTTTPFSGDSSDRRRRSVEQAVRESPELVLEILQKHPDQAGNIIESYTAANQTADYEVPQDEAGAPANTEAVTKPVLRKYDTVVMGEHVLAVHDSTEPNSKLQVLSLAGLPFLKEFFDEHAHEEGSDGSGETNVVVISDPPYGQGKSDITNDDIADWSEVYELFKPRGGFAFCAFHPPFFRRAEDGIIKAGGVPTEYLALNKGGGRIWGGDRVQNRLDGIIYFERNGNEPWLAGRHAISLLTPSRMKEAMEERRRLAGDHPTPKYVDVMTTLVELASDPGDIILDPFMGSGFTLFAAHRARRRFIGIELEPKHAERTVRNWQIETGQDAIVHRTFADGPISLSDLEKTPDWGDYKEGE